MKLGQLTPPSISLFKAVRGQLLERMHLTHLTKVQPQTDKRSHHMRRVLPITQPS